MHLDEYRTTDPPSRHARVTWLYEKSATPNHAHPMFQLLRQDMQAKLPYNHHLYRFDVRIYAALRLNTGAKIVSRPWQRKSDVNRNNSCVCYYYNCDHGPLYFGEVECFARVNDQWDMAYIREWSVTTEHGIALRNGFNKRYWIVADFIAGLVGIAPIRTLVNGRTATRQRIVGKNGVYDEVFRGGRRSR
jgi:hypothetical protein